MRILITGGGTREPIDGVRFITNFSTGGTAAALTDFFLGAGAEVTYLHARDAVQPKGELSRPGCQIQEFITFADLNAALQDLLAHREYDLIVHLAAVSDYSVASIEAVDSSANSETPSRRWQPSNEGKLPSQSELILRLKPNFKIVDRIKSYARFGRPTLIAFKLTHTPAENERLERVHTLSRNPDIDFVVHNDLGDRKNSRPLFTLYEQMRPVAKASSPVQLGAAILNLLSDREQPTSTRSSDDSCA